MQQDIDKRVAVVTGAASGIGLALATRAAREGMSVVLADVEKDALEAAVLDLRRQELDVRGVLTDVSRQDSVEALCRETLAAYGKVHMVFNNAGVAGAFSVPIWEATPKDWEWLFGVNFWGVVNGVRAFLPRILEQGEGGHVVNTASVAGLLAGNGIYGVSKHAVVSFSEAIYSQLTAMRSNVGVSVLCPGFVRTRIIEADRNRPPELRNEGATAIEPQRRREVSRVVTEGIDPAVVADRVFEAIRERKLYILTHDNFDAGIRDRFENILGRRNPQPRPAAT